jgi:hypothetical protein
MDSADPRLISRLGSGPVQFGRLGGPRSDLYAITSSTTLLNLLCGNLLVEECPAVSRHLHVQSSIDTHAHRPGVPISCVPFCWPVQQLKYSSIAGWQCASPRPLKAWMGATHFLTKTLPRVSTEMSLHVLAYNFKRLMRILGAQEVIRAVRT